MKTLVKALIVVTLVFGLVACVKRPPSLEDRVVDIDENLNEYTGVIETFDINIYQDGTHQLRMTDEEVVVIQSPTINLNNYLGKEVTVHGSLQKLIDDKSEVFTVDGIKLEDGQGDGTMADYENKKFGFHFEYPALWELIEESQRLIFRSNGNEQVVIDIYNTDADVDAFVAGREVEDGTPVTIGGQRSIRYVEPQEIRIYIPNSSKEKVYRVLFDSEGEKAQKDLFYDFLESFTPLVSKRRTGEKCGGEENLTCPEEFRCELESGEEDATGICISVDEASADLDCPFVSTPFGCQNYEAKSFNKDGCPTSYECLDEPEPEIDEEPNNNTAETSGDAVGAQDLAPNEDPIEDPIEEPVVEEPVEDTSISDDVASTFLKYQDKILDGAELLQIEIVEAQDLIAAIYLAEDQKYRTLYSYESSGNEFNFQQLSHYEAGEERDWVLVEGEEVRITSAKKIIKVGGGNGNVQVIHEELRLYENPHKDFSLQYPRNYYYRSFGSIENTVWTVGFDDKPLDHVSDATITAVILDGMSLGKKEMKGDRYLVEVERDSDSHFLLEGPLTMKDTLDLMATTIIQN